MTVLVQAGVASGKPWGIWSSIAWVVAALGGNFALGIGLRQLPLPEVVDLFLISALTIVVIVVAVRARRLAVASYLAWTVPRPAAVLFALVAVPASIIVFDALNNAIGDWPSIDIIVSTYRQYLTDGGSPLHYLLPWYPTYIYAPILEETVFRGFLWRGFASCRLGNWGTWLLTSALFAVAHIGLDRPADFIRIGVAGLLLGLVRWRTGSSTASMITHCLLNLWPTAGAFLLVAIGWP